MSLIVSVALENAARNIIGRGWAYRDKKWTGWPASNYWQNSSSLWNI